MTKAIILAAGMGSRLRPLTEDRPKCLVELAGKPLLDHQIRTLQSAGIFDIHVVGGYMADRLDRRDTTLHVNQQFATSNMVYTLFRVEQELGGEEDVIVSYGDIVYEAVVLEKLLRCKAELCVVSDREWLRYWCARFSDPLDDAETFRIGPDGRIISLGKKPHTIEEVEGQFIGLMKFRHDSLPKLRRTWLSLQRELSPGEVKAMYTTDLLQHLIDEGWEASPVFIDNHWAEIDSPTDLAVATDFFRPEE